MVASFYFTAYCIMKRYAAFILLFARNIWFWNLLFTAACLLYVLKSHELNFAVFTGVKSAGYISALFFEYFMEKQRFYFFRNAGFSVSKLAFVYFGVDFLLNLILCFAVWLMLIALSSSPTV